MEHLLVFYGDGCEACDDLFADLERLKQEEGITVRYLEVWGNQENERLFEEYNRGYCPGVPFLYNTHTDKWLCGAAPYRVIRSWVHGE